MLYVYNNVELNLFVYILSLNIKLYHLIKSEDSFSLNIIIELNLLTIVNNWQ